MEDWGPPTKAPSCACQPIDNIGPVFADDRVLRLIAGNSSMTGKAGFGVEQPKLGHAGCVAETVEVTVPRDPSVAPPWPHTPPGPNETSYKKQDRQ